MKLGRCRVCQKLQGGVQSFGCPNDGDRENDPTPIRARDVEEETCKKNRYCRSGVNPRVMLAANHAQDAGYRVIEAANAAGKLERARSVKLFGSVAHARCLTVIGRIFAKGHFCFLRHPPHARTGTLAVRSSLPQLTHAPLIARRIAFQMQ